MLPSCSVTVAVLLMSLLDPVPAQEEDIGCFVPGECLHSLYLDVIEPDDPLGCLQGCQELEGCNFFTHFGDLQVCYLFETCVELSTADCDDCVSGDSECSEDDICFVEGVRCQGVEVDFATGIDTAEECRDLCQDTDGCAWFTYESDSICTMTENCPTYAECGDCTVGAATCSDGGGSDGGEGGFVGLVDTEGRPMVCGGADLSDRKQCYTYWFEEDSWTAGPSMLYDRYYTGVARLLDGRQWLVGGGPDFTTQSTSEYFDGVAFTRGPDLPLAMYYACAVTLDNGTVFVADGDSAYFFDADAENFAQLPNIPYYDNYQSGCGTAASPLGGTDVVVVGDYTNPDSVYNTDSGQWRELEFHSDPGRSTTVPLGDSFVTLGGFDSYNGIYLDEVYQYGEEDEDWILREERLLQEKAYFAAIVVSKDVLKCDEPRFKVDIVNG